MRGCLSDSEIVALAADTPLQGDRAAIDAHLSSCAECRGRVQVARERSANDPSVTAGVWTASASPASSKPAIVLEGYDVMERIQGGGQGVVFKALQKSTSRMVAVKVLPHEESASDRQKQRFEREVSLAASLRHPNIVTIYDSGLTSGRYFFAMEYVHGQPLDHYAATLDQRGKLALFAKVCDAVAYAHQQNIVHRDLKPGNILVDARGEPHILDFGLAKSAANVFAHGQQPLTLTSQFMGTLAYASPEQTLGDPTLVDRRSDVYALGVILFEMLTGMFPYPMPGDLVGTFESIRNHPPRKPSQAMTKSTRSAAGASANSIINRDLDTIVLRMLSKEPARRYQSAEELAADVHRYLAGEPIAARRDSMSYVFGIRARAALRRHPVFSRLVVIALATTLATFLTIWVARFWHWPARWFEFVAARSSDTLAAASAGLEDVRVVAVTDHTAESIGELANEASIEGVKTSEWVTSRRLHGHLMQRLSKTAVRAVVWDFAYRKASDSDAEFVKGIKALQDAGIGVVVGMWNWKLNERGEPADMSPAIVKSGALWGGITADADEHSIWKLDLVVQHPKKAPILSLALAGLSAWRHPNLDVAAPLDSWNARVELQYRDRNTQVMQAVQAYETVTLTTVRHPDFSTDEKTANNTDLGLESDSWVGYYAINLPDRATLDAITIDYDKIFRMNDTDLAAWANGKMLVFGDFRTTETGMGVDEHIAPDGRRLHGSHAHAIGLGMLLRDVVPARYPTLTGELALLAIGAVLGLAAAHQRLGRLHIRIACALIVSLAMVILAILAYRLTGYLCQPLGPIIAFALAFLAWLWFDPLYRQARTEAQPGVPIR